MLSITTRFELYGIVLELYKKIPTLKLFVNNAGANMDTAKILT